MVEVLLPHQQSTIRAGGANVGVDGKVIDGAGGLHWSLLRPEGEAEGSVTATQMLSELIQRRSWVPSGPTFLENRNKCE